MDETRRMEEESVVKHKHHGRSTDSSGLQTREGLLAREKIETPRYGGVPSNQDKIVPSAGRRPKPITTPCPSPGARQTTAEQDMEVGALRHWRNLAMPN